ncbi:MAG: hypothetical protein ACEQSD_05195 [Flavobacteriales bacterium]
MTQPYSTRILSCLVVLLVSSTSVFAQDATTAVPAATDPNAAPSCCCADMKNMDMGKTGTPSKCMTPAKTLMDQGAMKGMNHAGMDHSQMQHAPVTPSGAVASPITEHGGH